MKPQVPVAVQARIAHMARTAAKAAEPVRLALQVPQQHSAVARWLATREPADWGIAACSDLALPMQLQEQVASAAPEPAMRAQVAASSTAPPAQAAAQQLQALQQRAAPPVRSAAPVAQARVPARPEQPDHSSPARR